MKRQNHKLNKKFVQTRRNDIFIRGCLGLLLASLGTVALGMVFLSSGVVSATIGTAKNDISVKVSGYCSVSNENHTYNKDIGTGSFAEIGSGNVFDIYCNDEEGYVVYAVGNGKSTETGETTEGVTDLIGTDMNNKIPTGILTSGDISNWSFKLSNATAGMTIENGFADNAPIPSTRTKVVSRPAGTAAASGDNFTATYSAYISISQKPDTYSGGVKYVLFHPSTTGPEGPVDYSCDIDGEKTNTLTDPRDSKTYSIATLADGKCWMTQNLAIENYELTSADSDVSSNFTLPESSTSGFNSSSIASVYVNGTYGGYYNWLAATAGEGTEAKSSGNVSHSICPKGWRLPTKAEFDNLVSKQGAANMTKSPANFVLSGSYNNGSPSNQTSNGRYWSSTASVNNRAYILVVYSSSANTSGSSKNLGYSVRCVSRQ